MIRVGTLRHRVTIEQPVRVDDEGGGAELSWVPLASAWAFIEPLSGREKTQYEGLEATLTYRITLRYRGDLKPEMRFVHEGRLFDIHSIRNVEERNISLICQCTEVIEQ